MTVKELETVVARLSPAELAEFARWFDRHFQEAWDRQLAQDIRTGRLDEAMRQAEEEVKAGRLRPL